MPFVSSPICFAFEPLTAPSQLANASASRTFSLPRNVAHRETILFIRECAVLANVRVTQCVRRKRGPHLHESPRRYQTIMSQVRESAVTGA